MADRKRIVRKVDEDEDDVQAEEVDVEEDTIEDDVQDEEDDTPPAKPARKVVVPPPAAKKIAVPVKAAHPVAKPAVKAPAAPIKKVIAPPAKSHPVAAPAPKPMLKKAVPAPEPDEEDEPAAPVTLTKVKKVDAQLADMLLTGIVNHLNDHQAIVVTRLDDGKYTVALADAKAVASTAGKLSGQAYWNEVCTPEYQNWQAEWKVLTNAEKVALCKKSKVTWERYDNAMVDNIHMTDAYRTAMGIEKYKDEYKSQKQREAIRA